MSNSKPNPLIQESKQAKFLLRLSKVHFHSYLDFVDYTKIVYVRERDFYT